ncbi:hypothetical protein IAR55_000676 [Kwoniella newhampshirensis]|uniref:Fe2OG dioxygenase domain-containing protein n=1 Tax=Kwoniella newhampshirensis TaxID=1651941 RepID=A0AAW0Z9W2_9TREE
MGKRAEQAKKRRRLAQNPSAGKTSIPAYLPSPPDLDDEDDQLVSSEDLATTIFVLQTLCQNPEELSNKGMKDLKRATYELHRVMAEGAAIGSSLTSKISAALQDYRFKDALVYLFEMYTRKLPPKLGALQRWVRECDATSSSDGSAGDAEAMRCLDMILRIANMSPENGAEEGEVAETAIVRRKGIWRAREAVEGEIKVAGIIPKGNIYASSPSAIQLSTQRPTPTKHDVPGVPGAFLVTDVLTPEECLQIVQAASSVGFERDEAAQGSARMKTSILARNFVWLADQPFLDHFYSQILPFVPKSAPTSVDGNGGGKVRGINARFRVYQYTENQVYRPHIDGAWPAAGLDPVTGEYLHDSSPSNDPLWSRYTLLVYLNSDIPRDTGATTFFLPSSEVGTLDAISVAPVQGAVLCFPHGDTQGSLLHEGSAVGAEGRKFVIRTDLLYEAKGFGAFKPPASVGVVQGGKAEEGIGG